MYSIDWEAVGNQRFNVFDPLCGFWVDGGNGFVNSQQKAKTYTQDQLTEDERRSIIQTKCILMSNPDPEPVQKPEKNKNNKRTPLDNDPNM